MVINATFAAFFHRLTPWEFLNRPNVIYAFLYSKQKITDKKLYSIINIINIIFNAKYLNINIIFLKSL